MDGYQTESSSAPTCLDLNEMSEVDVLDVAAVPRPSKTTIVGQKRFLMT